METDRNQTYCDHSIMYINVRSLFGISKTDIILYVNYTSIKKIKSTQLNFFFFKEFKEEKQSPLSHRFCLSGVEEGGGEEEEAGRGRRCKERMDWISMEWADKNSTFGVPVVVQGKRIQIGTMRFRVRSLALLSWLRILCCHELWCRWQRQLWSRVAVAVVLASGCSSDLTCSLGTSICQGCGPKKQKKRNREVDCFGQGHTASRWQSWDLISVLSSPSHTRDSGSEMLSRLRHASFAVSSRFLSLLLQPLIHCSSAQWNRKARDPGCIVKESFTGPLVLSYLPTAISNPLIRGSFLWVLKGMDFFFFFFVQLHLWHMEVPELDIISAVAETYATATATPDRSPVCDLQHSFQQH